MICLRRKQNEVKGGCDYLLLSIYDNVSMSELFEFIDRLKWRGWVLSFHQAQGEKSLKSRCSRLQIIVVECKSLHQEWEKFSQAWQSCSTQHPYHEPWSFRCCSLQWQLLNLRIAFDLMIVLADLCLLCVSLCSVPHVISVKDTLCWPLVVWL